MITVKEYLELCGKPCPLSNEDLDKLIEYNDWLMTEYPFLIPRECNDEIIDNTCLDGRTYTELDDLPNGWRIVFGNDICEELKNELIKFNCLDKYRIVQIKEKFGTLRWYDYGYPVECKVRDIIRKYEEMSEKICIECGKPAKWITKGWINFICDDCGEEQLKKYNQKNTKKHYTKNELFGKIYTERT